MGEKVRLSWLMVLVFIIAGCTSTNPSAEIATGKAVFSDDAIVEPEQLSVCNRPYFEYKQGECCPDTNDNRLCDWDETFQEQPHSYDTEEIPPTQDEFDFTTKLPKSLDIRKEHPRMIDEDDHILGIEDAKLIFVLFQDFESPYSKEFEEKIMPDLKLDYINTGKARLVFKHYPLPYFENSKKAAEAVECAGMQGKFWEMKKLLFANSPGLSNTLYFDLAHELNLDIDAFRLCFESGEMGDRIDYDKAFGDYLWMEKTPTLFVNGRRVDGLAPWREYEETIQKVQRWEWESAR